jgi:hypothetical protein
MASSGTYAFNPALGELTLYAFNLCGVRNTALEQEHFESARMATNLMLGRWSNQGVNLWKVIKTTIPLAQSPGTIGASGDGTTATLTYATPNTPIYTVGGQITVTGLTPTGYNGTYTVTDAGPGFVSYANTTTSAQIIPGVITSSLPAPTFAVDPATVMILDTYVTLGTTGTNTEIDRIIMPVSRTEYASYPNKQQTGFPTVYWFNRLISPTIAVWPAPDGNQVNLVYYSVIQVQDSAFSGGQTLDIPQLWLEAFAYGLAQRLALIWNPPAAAMLKPLADEAYMIAAEQNTEYAAFYVSPQISGYFR